MKKYGIIFALFCYINTNIATAQEEILLDEIVAVVGKNIVLRSEVEIQAIQAKMQGMEEENIECQILDQMLLEKMFITHAQLDSLVVGEEEVQGELDNRMQYYIQLFNGDVDRLEEYYNKTVLQLKEELRGDIRDQLLARRMQSEIVGSIKVTPAEVREFFNSIPTDSIPYLNAEIELMEIVVKPEVSEEKKQEVKDKLLGFKAQVKTGEADFGALAKKHSQDPGSAAQDGDLGWFSRGQMVPEFEGAVFKLNEGEMSNIVETQFGYHLILLEERRGEKVKARHILIKPETTSEEMTNAEKRLDSIRAEIVKDTISFREAVLKYTEDEMGKKTGGVLYNQYSGTGIFEMDQLDPQVFFAIEELVVGEISDPIRFRQQDGKEDFRIFYVSHRTKPHLANLKDDYAKMQKIVESRKQQEAMETWLERKGPKTYISIDEEYNACSMLNKWSNESLKE